MVSSIQANVGQQAVGATSIPVYTQQPMVQYTMPDDTVEISGKEQKKAKVKKGLKIALITAAAAGLAIFAGKKIKNAHINDKVGNSSKIAETVKNVANNVSPNVDKVVDASVKDSFKNAISNAVSSEKIADTSKIADAVKNTVNQVKVDTSTSKIIDKTGTNIVNSIEEAKKHPIPKIPREVARHSVSYRQFKMFYNSNPNAVNNLPSTVNNSNIAKGLSNIINNSKN